MVDGEAPMSLLPILLVSCALAFSSTSAEPPASQATKPVAKAHPTPAPRSTPPPVLEGTVKGPDTKPLEGALVSAWPTVGRWDEPARTCRTDAAGRFKLNLASSDPHDLRVEAAGLAAARLDKVRPGVSVAVTLGRGRTIEGAVRDDGGQPVAGARVTARSETGLAVSVWEPGAGSVLAVTDARGRFRLEGIAPGLHSLTATARGYGEASRRNVRPGATVSLTLRSGGWIAGRVLDPSEKPVKGALVRAEQEPRFWQTSQTETTDGEGRFDLPGLPAGRYTVIASAPGFAPGIEPGVNVPAEGPADVTVSLARGASIVGRIVDAQLRPLKGQARIQELARQELPTSAGEILKADAKDDGRFRIERVPAGSWTLGITSAGFAGQRVEADLSTREPSLDLGDIVLERGLTLHGRVRTASGAPIGGAAISAYPDDGGSDEAWAPSGEDGTFVLAGLQPGLYDLDVRAAGFAPLRKQLSPGPDDADLVLLPGGAITGLVVEEGDRPVDSYRVVANADRADRRTSSDAGKSVGSPDGRFLLEDVAEGTYVVQVLAPERTPGSVSGLKVAAGRTTDAGTIRLSRGGVVRGTVVDLGGNAIEGATVKAVGPGEGRQRWMDLNTAVTDSAGSFEIQGVAPGNATVGAGHPQYAPSDTTVMVDPAKGPSEVRLTLQQGGRIEGSARRREGTPLPGLTVSVWQRGRRSVVSSGFGGWRPEPTARSCSSTCRPAWSRSA